MAGIPVKRSRGFIEVGLNVSQHYDTEARKQNKTKQNPNRSLEAVVSWCSAWARPHWEHKPHFIGENDTLESVCCWETKIGLCKSNYVRNSWEKIDIVSLGFYKKIKEIWDSHLQDLER